MKKFLPILVVFMIFGSVGLFAQSLSDSASLFLSGTVGEFVSVDVTPEPAATGLALTAGQASPLLVATVTETSNTAYEVTASSANAFNFSDGTNDLSYTLYYDGAAVTSSGDTVSSGASASGVSRPVTVTFPAAGSGADTGVYSDTVTFTISTTP